MKRILIISVFSFITLIALNAQETTLTFSGTVLDEQGQELIGVTIYVKDNPNIGTVSDEEGRFRLEKIPRNSVVVVSYVGYETLEIKLNTSKERQLITLREKIDELEELVVVGRGQQRKISVVGAVTNVEPEELQVPAVSVSNMLGGRVPGIISVTRSGEPGQNYSEFWIRGISTFGASQSALVLVDGVEGNLNDIDPADIESFSILKDASSTAVYGTRGANGVVLVTTKRGKAGKLRVNFKSNATYSYSPRMPEYADAYNYALLANEARAVRGDDPIYTDAELELFKTGLDPDLYPNVSWKDVILKDYVLNNQHHLNVSGGAQNARYYFSLGILNSDAIFNQDKAATKHDVNVKYHKYNFRANIDANLTRSTVLNLNLEAVIKNQNAPGNGDNNNALWSAQANLPPTMVPVRYSNGQLPSYGSNLDEMSPYVQLNYTGYTTKEYYNTKINVGLSQNLDALTQGLSARLLFSYKTNGGHFVDRSMRPDLYYADPKNGRYSDGS